MNLFSRVSPSSAADCFGGRGDFSNRADFFCLRKLVIFLSVPLSFWLLLSVLRLPVPPFSSNLKLAERSRSDVRMRGLEIFFFFLVYANRLSLVWIWFSWLTFICLFLQVKSFRRTPLIVLLSLSLFVLFEKFSLVPKAVNLHHATFNTISPGCVKLCPFLLLFPNVRFSCVAIFIYRE